MLSVCPYFHVHQPYRVKKYRVFDIGNDNQYFNDSSETDLNNRRILEKGIQKVSFNLRDHNLVPGVYYLIMTNNLNEKKTSKIIVE